MIESFVGSILANLVTDAMKEQMHNLGRYIITLLVSCTVLTCFLVGAKTLMQHPKTGDTYNIEKVEFKIDKVDVYTTTPTVPLTKPTETPCIKN